MTLRVAVIGGGCSGTLVAAEVMRGADGPVSVTVVDAGRVLGRGLAYGTPTAVPEIRVQARQAARSALAGRAEPANSHDHATHETVLTRAQYTTMTMGQVR